MQKIIFITCGALLGLVLICSRGLVLSSGSSLLTAAELLLVLSLLGAIYLSHYLSGWKRADSFFPVYWTLAAAYIALIIIDGGIHYAALRLLPDGLAINMQGETAVAWSHRTIGFTVSYFMFPLFLLAQYILFRLISVQGGIRILAICLSISLTVLFYQHFVDTAALNPWGNNSRVNGLSSDANAFSLMGFLMMPLLIAGYLLENSRYVRWVYPTCLLLLIPAIWLTGARSGSTASLLFLLLLPALAGIANVGWHRRKRAVFVLVPLLLFPIILILLPTAIDYLQHFGTAGARLASTWEHIQRFGVIETFWHESARGMFARLAWPWFLDAPLSGWGPGGFYREYSNLVHQAFGTVEIRFIDNVTNHYLMLATDLGLPALLLNLALILTPIWLGMRLLPRVTDPATRMVILTLVCSEGLFLLMIFVMPPSYFWDVMWVWSAQLAIFLIMIRQYGGVYWKDMRWLPVRSVAIFALILGVLTTYGSLRVVSGEKGYAARQHASWWRGGKERNCFPPELKGDRLVRWCGKNAVIAFPMGYIPKRPTVSNQVWVELLTPEFAAVDYPLAVTIGGLHGGQHAIEIADHQWHLVPVALSSEDVVDRTGGIDRPRRYAMLSIDVSRSVKDELGRDVGVAIALPKFLFPEFRK